eukprot:15449915-Alexandrium_andersonii.AAC.1
MNFTTPANSCPTGLPPGDHARNVVVAALAAHDEATVPHLAALALPLVPIALGLDLRTAVFAYFRTPVILADRRR